MLKLLRVFFIFFKGIFKGCKDNIFPLKASIGAGKLLSVKLPLAALEKQATSMQESRAVVLLFRTAESLHCTSLSKGQVCRLQSPSLLADVLHGITIGTSSQTFINSSLVTLQNLECFTLQIFGQKTLLDSSKFFFQLFQVVSYLQRLLQSFQLL